MNPWKSWPIRAFDTETTGLDVTAEKIWEIAFVTEENGGLTIDQRYAHPIMPIDQKLLEKLGVSVERYQKALNAPPFAALAPWAMAQLDRFNNADDPGILISYNGEFYDINLIESELLRAAGVNFTVDRGRHVDVLAIVRQIFPNLPKKGLEHVARHLGLEVEAAHEAANDCLMTIRVFDKLLPKLPDSWAEFRTAYDQIILRQRHDHKNYGIFLRTEYPSRRLVVNCGNGVGKYLDESPWSIKWALDKPDCPIGARKAIEEALAKKGRRS